VSWHSTRPSVVDAAFVTLVPAVLLAVFLLPTAVKRDLALLYTEPTLLSLYTAHFVHLDLSHIVANLLVYLLVVPFSLAVSVWSGRRRQFYTMCLVVLVIFPMVLSGLNVLFPRPRLGLGFSGLNMAFVGYLPHVLAGRFDAERPEWPETQAALLTTAFFVGTGIVAIRLVGSLGGAPRIAFGWLFVAGLGSVIVAGSFVGPVISYLRLQGFSGDAIPPLAVLGGLLFVTLVFVGFPHVSPTDGTVVNLFLHVLGYSLGYLLPYVAFRVVGLSLDDPIGPPD
jgi:hypothetical protein